MIIDCDPSAKAISIPVLLYVQLRLQLLLAVYRLDIPPSAPTILGYLYMFQA